PAVWKKTASLAPANVAPLSVGLLFDSLRAHTELLRSRVQRAVVGSGRASFRVDSPAGEAVFHAKTNWDSRNDALAALRLK
ncbi:MAG: hypothetical protein WA823_20085, partial [Candidatus Acidiferrales bacterium]